MHITRLFFLPFNTEGTLVPVYQHRPCKKLHFKLVFHFLDTNFYNFFSPFFMYYLNKKKNEKKLSRSQLTKTLNQEYIHRFLVSFEVVL